MLIFASHVKMQKSRSSYSTRVDPSNIININSIDLKFKVSIVLLISNLGYVQDQLERLMYFMLLYYLDLQFDPITPHLKGSLLFILLCPTFLHFRQLSH